MASEAIDVGKHVLCEKPLATTSAQAASLAARAAAKNVRHATCYNLRFYPMVQQMRAMREAGELGEILVAQGTYSQDWLLLDTDWNWRVEAKAAGPLRAMGDIGSHSCDMVEHVSGERIGSVCVDLATFHASRAGTVVDTEDFAGVLFHLGARARGAFTVSQVSAGCKNRLSLEIYGTRASVRWNQERPDELWIGHRDRRNEILMKDPALLDPRAAPLRTCRAVTPKDMPTPSSSCSGASISPLRTPALRRTTRGSKTACGRCGCSTRRLPATSAGAGWM